MSVYSGIVGEIARIE